MERRMNRLALPLFAATIFPGCQRAPEAPRVIVENAVVTVPAVPGGPGAAYFTLRTNNDPTRLVAIASPAVRSIELHETREQNGRTQMAPLERGALTFGPAAELVFSPGGRHAMLMGVDPALRPGGKVTLTFNFEPAPPVTVEAQVRGPGQGHAGH
jgi:copper(I)-binding protein